MSKDERILTIRRQAAGPKEGGASDDNAQFDFLQETNTENLKNYDEADAYDGDGSKRPEGDQLEFENGLPAPTKISAKERKLATPSNLELKKAKVAAKIAALLLPNANAEAIENQAAIFLRTMSASELSETLERCWYDRQGAKIAASRIAAKSRKQAAEMATLDNAEKLAGDLEEEVTAGNVIADEEMAEVDDGAIDDVAEDMAGGEAEVDVEDDLGLEEEEEVAADEMMLPEEEAISVERSDAVPDIDAQASEDVTSSMEQEAGDRIAASGKKLQQKTVKRTAGAKPTAAKSGPKIGTPKRRVTTASTKISETQKLSAAYSRQLGVPSDADMEKVLNVFKD